jgi:hypothetical protein
LCGVLLLALVIAVLTPPPAYAAQPYRPPLDPSYHTLHHQRLPTDERQPNRSKLPMTVMHSAALAFLVRARRASGHPRSTAAPRWWPAPTLSYATPIAPRAPRRVGQTIPNERAAVVFWRAPAYQRVPSPGQGFSIGGCAPTLRADAPKNVWPAAPLRTVVCGLAVFTVLHGENRGAIRTC